MYPDDCLHAYVSRWWDEDTTKVVQRGSLVWAFLPHVEQEPRRLVPVGRGSDPTDHTRCDYRIETLRIASPPPRPPLPVAALPSFPDETLLVHRAKKRPALVVSTGGAEVEPAMRRGAGARWQSAPTILVAPYYGADKTPDRAGWSPALVERIRRCEYPQYVWDMLPIRGWSSTVSVLRLDHIQPIGRHANSFEITGHRLAPEAMRFLDEWMIWISTGLLPEDGILHGFRKDLAELAQS